MVSLERQKFQEGEKKVAIISDAASTGISLHAEQPSTSKYGQARPRLQITIELPWSGDKIIQQLGLRT